MSEWDIYHGDQKYASKMNDPLLGRITADSKEQAEMDAAQTMYSPMGFYAVEVPNTDQKQEEKRGEDRKAAQATEQQYGARVTVENSSLVDSQHAPKQERKEDLHQEWSMGMDL